MLIGLNKLIEWSIKNKEWVFSGAGISVIGLVILLIKKIFNINKNYKVQSININYNNNALEPSLQLKSNEEHDELNYEMLRLVDRFISIYSNHGILINQIASFINPDFGLKLSDFKDRQSILQILDDKIINWTCETFGVQREWIDGKV